MFGAGYGACVRFFLLLMLVSPILIRFLEKLNIHSAAKIFAYLGYAWMGFLFLFCSISLVIDLCRFIASIIIYIINKKYIFSSSPYYFYIPLILSMTICIYGYYEAKNIRVEKIAIKTNKIAKNIGKIKVIQISDIHLGFLVNYSRLNNIVEIIKKYDPDIIFSTGDLLDASTNNLQKCIELLKELKPKYGKYAVTGNHEYFAGIENSVALTEKAGFVLLRQECTNVQNIINIIGVDDSVGKYYGLNKDYINKEILLELPKGQFTILLKHRPEINEGDLGYFDLQLSGHTHKGQIFPFSIVISLFYPYYYGMCNLEGNKYLYVNRGAGTWGPLIRFMAPPEITEIEVVSI